eukprot:1893810-Alexandrium_andersonii.AAC.1
MEEGLVRGQDGHLQSIAQLLAIFEEPGVLHEAPDCRGDLIGWDGGPRPPGGALRGWCCHTGRHELQQRWLRLKIHSEVLVPLAAFQVAGVRKHWSPQAAIHMAGVRKH